MYEQQTTDIDTRSSIFEGITARVTSLVNTIQNNVTAQASLKLQAEANADSSGATPGPVSDLIYIGPENRWAPLDAVFVPYSNRNNLQSILNSNKKVELEGADYNVALVLPNGSELYGIPGKTRVSSMTFAQDASNIVAKGVGGDVIIPANSGDHRACAMGATVNMGITSEGTLHDSLFFRTFESQIWMNNSVSGRHYNLRFFNPQSHGAGAFDGRSALQFNGRPDLSSYSIGVFAGNHLTPDSSVADSSYVEDLNFICGGMERGPENTSNGKPTYLFSDCGTVRIRSLTGYDPCAPYPLGLTRVKNAHIANFNLGTPNATKFTFNAVDNLFMLPSIDSDRMVDNGLPGIPSKLRIKAQWSGNGPNGISYNGSFPSQLTGADVTAAMAMVVQDQHTYRAWAPVVERAVPALLGSNWQDVAAASPDMTGELQTLLNNAGENGVARLNKIYYCSNTINLPLGCALIGSGSTTSGVVMKSQAVDMFQHNWSGGNVFRDLTFQGGKSFLASIHAAQQYTGGFFLYCVVRDQAEAAIDLRYTYGWDNNYFEGMHFVNCGVMFRSVGRISGVGGSVGGEDVEMAYSDKSIFMRCQFIGVDYLAQLRPKRPSGGFVYFECYIGNTKKGVYDLDAYAVEFQFINCTIKNCKATIGERILFSYQGSPDNGMDFIGTTIENPEAAYLWHPGSKYEGIKLIKGSFAGKAFRPIPDSDPRDSPTTTIENSDFDTVPTGISLSSIASGSAACSSFIVVNSRFAAAEDSALAGAISVLAYNSKGTPDRGDDVIVQQLNWLPGTPLPTSKLLRDRI